MVRPSLSAKVLTALAGKRLATAESLTGGGIGQALTSVSGASAVFAGGVISYTNEVKHKVLGVPVETLNTLGPVSAPVAQAMAQGARLRRCGVKDIEISCDCTACRPDRFWSHRRVGNDRGSLAAIIVCEGGDTK